MNDNPLLRDPDDPNLPAFYIDHERPGPIPGWTSGYFWWERYTVPAYATAIVGAAGDICFPIYSGWSDGHWYRSFLLRLDRARGIVELLTPPGEWDGWATDGEPESVTVTDAYDEEFQPDLLFSELTRSYLTVKLLEPVQAQFLSSTWDDAPPPEKVWRPVDIGQPPETVQVVSDNDTGIGELISEERAGRNT